ncbi:interleukin-1 receptor accessory -like 1-A isoform X3 [Labeo rohita]|uniref:ribonuclease H n=1 Tax=Labeo rohita TaxID=84645 RepID=A0A498NLW6_LABRO|nr:interleukin-1 receptor accessory -like 1-A isoform X3 [Labeo rohita]
MSAEPTDLSYDKPTSVSYAMPADLSYNKPANLSYGKPASVSYGKPADLSYDNPANLSYDKPACVSYGKPADLSYDKPACVSYGKPADLSYDKPTSVSYAKPADLSYDKPACFSYAKPADLSYDKPACVSYGKPADLSYDKPTSVSYAKPADLSYGKPASVSYGKPTSISYGKPTSISYGKPADLSYDKPTSISYGKPANLSYDKPTSISYAKPAYLSYGKPTSVSYAMPANLSYGKPASVSYGKPADLSYDKPASISYTKPAYLSYGKPTSDFHCSEFPDACSFTLEQKVQRTADVLTDKQDEMSVTHALSLTKSGSNDSCAADDSTVLRDLGLADLDVESCNVSADCKAKLVQLISQYHSIFSRHKLDCGKATGFVHRIRLSDDKPFRLAYRRLAPTQYERLRQALDEMEEHEIIQKSSSEFASPLVLVWKKSGDLRICTDFHWINARTIKDVHPLPHQADALPALGRNAYFSTMDLTSGYYNVEVHEDDRKYTAFTSPFGLYEYNRLPQGLCNSPATFMRMMLTIFGDQNFISLLCYLDDVLVFAPTEELALERLEMVFKYSSDS